MEGRKPGDERRSIESRLRRSLIRLAIRAQDAKDLGDEMKRPSPGCRARRPRQTVQVADQGNNGWRFVVWLENLISAAPCVYLVVLARG
jgi:hypothetical protein